MNLKYLSTLFILAFILLSFESSFSQNGLKGRNNIKASHNYYSFTSSHYFQLEYNRGIRKFIEGGLYMATSRNFVPVIFTNPSIGENIIIGVKSRSYEYGIQTNIHPLQLLLKEGHRFRVDLYLNAKLGGRYSAIPSNALSQKEHFFFYDIGGGLAYHLFKHWGIYIEYNYRSPAKIRYGLSIKF